MTRKLCAGYFEQQPEAQHAASDLVSTATLFAASVLAHCSHASPQQSPSQLQLPGEQSTHLQFSQAQTSPQQQVFAVDATGEAAGLTILAYTNGEAIKQTAANNERVRNIDNSPI